MIKDPDRCDLCKLAQTKVVESVCDIHFKVILRIDQSLEFMNPASLIAL